MRIVSFLPSSTEMIYALGLGEQLVGVTHECDYPPDALTKQVVVRPSIEIKDVTPQQIDASVSQTLKSGGSLYHVDEQLLKELQPDLILTQDLCQVCAPSGNEVGRVLEFLPNSPEILWLSPSCLSDIFDNLLQVGKATGKVTESQKLLENLQARVERISRRVNLLNNRPRVFCMEWLSPIYNSGHWMPELVALAGGRDDLSWKGKDSTRVAWEKVMEYSPDFLILNPCGFHLKEVIEQAYLLTQYPGWEEMPAVKEGRVVCVDANSYFARPGPRVVDGLELMAAIIHPEEFSWSGFRDAYQILTFKELQKISLA